MAKLTKVSPCVYQVGEEVNGLYYFVEQISNTRWDAYAVEDPTDRYVIRVWCMSHCARRRDAVSHVNWHIRKNKA